MKFEIINEDTNTVNTIYITQKQYEEKISDIFPLDYRVHNKILKFNGKVLNKNISLFSNGIKSDSRRYEYLIISKAELMEISIRTLTGKSLSIQVFPYDLIEYIKNLIYNKEVIPFDQQRLIFLEFN